MINHKQKVTLTKTRYAHSNQPSKPQIHKWKPHHAHITETPPAFRCCHSTCNPIQFYPIHSNDCTDSIRACHGSIAGNKSRAYSTQRQESQRHLPLCCLVQGIQMQPTAPTSLNHPAQTKHKAVFSDPRSLQLTKARYAYRGREADL